MDTTVKSIIEEMVCPTHKQHPVVIEEEDGVKLKCCCADFKVQCFYLVKKMVSQQ